MKDSSALVPVAIHEQAIRDHVATALDELRLRMKIHDAVDQCTRTPQCRHCSLLAYSVAAIRRILDFLEVEVPKR